MHTIHAEQIPPGTTARDFLESLQGSHEEFVYVQDGAPRLLLVPTGIIEAREAAKREFFSTVDKLRQRNAGRDSDDVLEELEGMDDGR